MKTSGLTLPEWLCAEADEELKCGRPKKAAQLQAWAAQMTAAPLFTGKELFVHFQLRLASVSDHRYGCSNTEAAENEWELVLSKFKKRAWQELAAEINLKRVL